MLLMVDPEYDAYKHGAFLEKQDRFAEEKPSEIPGSIQSRSWYSHLAEWSSLSIGPGTFITDTKTGAMKAVPPRPGMRDKHANLQGKVDDLERALADNKHTVRGRAILRIPTAHQQLSEVEQAFRGNRTTQARAESSTKA